MKTCFLCGEKSKPIDFNEQNCCLKILFRKESGFKYGDILLTKEYSGGLGYCRACYQKLTVIKEKYTGQYLKFVKDFEVSKKLYDCQLCRSTKNNINHYYLQEREHFSNSNQKNANSSSDVIFYNNTYFNESNV